MLRKHIGPMVYINDLYQKNIVNGYTSTKFAPEKSFHELNLLRCLDVHLDLPNQTESKPFTDVPRMG